MKFYVASIDKASGASSKHTSTSVPKMSVFYGENSKNEVTYLIWKYQVNCLKLENTYSEEQVLNGIM